MGNTKRIFLVMATLLATIVGGSNVVSANSGGTIPAPPESGPQVEGNFTLMGTRRSKMRITVICRQILMARPV